MKIIESEIFKKYPEIKFGFSTKDGGVSPAPYFMNLSLATDDSDENVHRNRELFFERLDIPIENVNFQRQVHSDISREISQPGFAGECDATFTNKRNLFITISVADCIPVFLYEPRKKVIATVHSGWRGAQQKILAKTVGRMIEIYGINPSELIVHIGPGICREHFEVGEEVAELFNDDIKIKKDEKYYLDLKQENLKQLLASGVDESKVEISELCTFKEKDLLHSYRRDGKNSGRMFGVIGMI